MFVAMVRLGNLFSDGQFFMDFFQTRSLFYTQIYLLELICHVTQGCTANGNWKPVQRRLTYSSSLLHQADLNAVSDPWIRSTLWKATLGMSPQHDTDSFKMFLNAASLQNWPKQVQNTIVCSTVTLGRVIIYWRNTTKYLQWSLKT